MPTLTNANCCMPNMRERTTLVLTQSADPQLRAFANRIHGSDALRCIESVAALLGRKPMPKLEQCRRRHLPCGRRRRGAAPALV
jgi:hypothetical protein